MPGCLVDSNVLLDIMTVDSNWFAWSSNQLEKAGNDGRLIINAIIFAEISVGVPQIEALESALPITLFDREALPFEAAFLAGKCFKQYRERGGVRRSPLPDFFIGAHATVAGHRLLTRDPSRYRTYFPELEIVAPMTRPDR